MAIFKKVIAAQLVFLCFFLNPSPVFSQVQQAYERGTEEIRRGNASQALDIWYNSYNNPGPVDSRIGIEFIREVAENGMRSYYGTATRLYYKALTDGDGIESRVAIRQEIDRLKPVIGDGIHRQWMNWWEEESPELGSDMRGFWVQQDPTPARTPNERLIEHWQRIATAKKEFRKSNSTVYGSDDRALIYIRYGEPDRIKTGILTLQSANITRWLENQLPPEKKQTGNPPQDVTAGENDFMDRIHDAIYEFHRYPEYEIWFYDGIVENQKKPVIFLFGTDVRNDQFSLQTSLEDFIPERAFHAQDRDKKESLEFTRAGITPALILQLLYYEQLAQTDTFFEHRLNDLKNKLLEQGIQAFQGMDLAFQAESREIITRQVVQVPRHGSTYAGLIPKIPLDIYQYRLLSDSLKPEILTYVESSADEAFLIDYNRTYGRNLQSYENIDSVNVLEEFTYYELVHSLQSYDDSWKVAVNRHNQPPLYINRPSEKQVSVSVFRQSHTGKNPQSVSVELMNYDPDSKSIFETPFPASLRGWNKIQYRQPQPLTSHPDSLQVSDLVLGYHHQHENTEPFDFKVANNQLIPFGETLLLHFEVYNLESQTDGFSRFEMTYRILPVDKQGKILTDQTEFILTLNFTNEDTTVKEDLEIETTELNAGLYELVVSILDTESGQTKERKIRFEVVE